MDIPPLRSWTYNMIYPTRGGLRPEYIVGIDGFIGHAKKVPYFQIDVLIRCPCVKCERSKCLLLPPNEVASY